MADNEQAAPDNGGAAEKTEPTPAEKLEAALAKADGKGGEKDEKDEKEDEYDDAFKSKMEKYMKTEDGKKKYMSCNKAVKDETSEAENLLKAGMSPEMDGYRAEAAEAGLGDDEPLGYFLHLEEGNSFYKAIELIAQSVARQEKNVAALIEAQRETAELAKATAQYLHEEHARQDALAKAESARPNDVRTKRQDPGLAPPDNAGESRVDVKTANNTLMKAVQDGKLDEGVAFGYMHVIKQVNGNLGVLPDDMRTVIEPHLKEAV